MFEYSSILGFQPTIIDQQITGGGSSTWSNDSYINMAVSVSGDSVIRQSHDYIPYQPGKSKLIIMTGVLVTDLSVGARNVTSRIGSFDTTIGGVYIQYSGGTISVNLAKLNGSTPTTLSIPRSAWLDKLDGTGSSGVTVDFNKAQIFLFDLEWLGVGQVRCGIVQGGDIHYYYAFTNANTLVYPYIQMATLPLRYEITSNGSLNSMRMICGSVINEGGVSPPGRQFILSTDNVGQSYTLPNNNTFRPVISLSLRTVNPAIRGTIKLEEISIFSLDSNVAGSWKILFNPTITYTGPAPSWVDYDLPRESIARYRRDNGVGTIVSEGLVLYQGYFSQRTNYVFTTAIDELIASKGVSADIAGNPDVLVLAVNWLVGSNNTSVYPTLRWAEII
jgi:hypothetical protein